MQALDRTQLLLPLAPGRPERPTHDYAGHGTTALIAALDVVTGHVIGHCHQRHRQLEFLKFLDLIDQTIPAEPGVEIQLVMDNYATLKALRVKRWFAKRPHFQVHFTSTSASWLNQVERFIAEITEMRIRRGAFHRVAALKKAILEYLDHHNSDTKPFQWTAGADSIISRVKKVCQRISNTGH